MNLLVVGATGNIGREVLDLALARGHRVTAFVRSPQKIGRSHPELVVRAGNPLEVGELAPALEGQDAVLSSLGLPAKQALRPSTFMAESAAATLAAMKVAGLRRLCIVSAAVLFPGRGLAHAFFEWLLKHHARDLQAMETVLRATDLDWTIARPPRLVRSSDERYVAREGALPEGGSTASFRAVAAFLLDAVEHRRHVRDIVGVLQAA